MKTSKRFLLTAVFAAITFTFFACSGDDSGPNSPSPVSSDSSGGGEEQKVFCKLTAGNCSQMSLSTCMELVNAGAAQIVANCNTEPEPNLSSSSAPGNTQSSSSVLLSSSSVTQSSSSVLLSSSSVTPSSSSVVIFGYCNYGPVKADGTGGCFPMATDEDSANCALYGNVVSSCPVFGSFVYLSQTYKTVKIGNQWWMAENLNRSMWNTTSTTVAGLCYDNLDANCSSFGRLYTWAEAMGLSSSCNTSSCASQINAKQQGLCPVGWHIPSYEDWNTLMTTIGGTNTGGKKLKAKNGNWAIYNGQSGNGTDEYGFEALAGGIRTFGIATIFANKSYSSNWWSAASDEVATAYQISMSYSDDKIDWATASKQVMGYVRCVQD